MRAVEHAALTIVACAVLWGGALPAAEAFVGELVKAAAAMCAAAPVPVIILVRTAVRGGVVEAVDGRTASLVPAAGGHARRCAHCSGRGVPRLAGGAAPQMWTAHPRGHPQNIPIRACKGMTCPNLRQIGSGRGRGFSLVVFPAPLLLV